MAINNLIGNTTGSTQHIITGRLHQTSPSRPPAISPPQVRQTGRLQGLTVVFVSCAVNRGTQPNGAPRSVSLLSKVAFSRPSHVHHGNLGLTLLHQIPLLHRNGLWILVPRIMSLLTYIIYHCTLLMMAPMV